MSSALSGQCGAFLEHEIAQEVCVTLPHGLHSRPSAALAQLAQKFESTLLLLTANGKADAKSMLDILSLAVTTRTKVTILAHGPDAAEAIDQICNYLGQACE